MWGQLHGVDSLGLGETANVVMKEGMKSFCPSKRSPAGQFLSAANSVCQSSHFLANFRPKAIVGGPGNWVSFGPVTQDCCRKIERALEWSDLVDHLEDTFPRSGDILLVKVAVHNDGSRSLLSTERHCIIDLHDDSECFSPLKPAATPDKHSGGDVQQVDADASQTRISDFF